MFSVIKIRKTPEFEERLSGLTAKEEGQVEARLFRIQEFEHFGDFKPIEGSDFPIFELRWKNGWRVYFYKEGRVAIMLLLGGKKNDQKKDIKKAEILFKRYAFSKK
jgi:putative addiction module killer protein